MPHRSRGFIAGLSTRHYIHLKRGKDKGLDVDWRQNGDRQVYRDFHRVQKEQLGVWGVRLRRQNNSSAQTQTFNSKESGCNNYRKDLGDNITGQLPENSFVQIINGVGVSHHVLTVSKTEVWDRRNSYKGVSVGCVLYWRRRQWRGHDQSFQRRNRHIREGGDVGFDGFGLLHQRIQANSATNNMAWPPSLYLNLANLYVCNLSRRSIGCNTMFVFSYALLYINNNNQRERPRLLCDFFHKFIRAFAYH